ncbi:FKBP70, partial [Symbiodinium sp. CCMP2456]
WQRAQRCWMTISTPRKAAKCWHPLPMALLQCRGVRLHQPLHHLPHRPSQQLKHPLPGKLDGVHVTMRRHMRCTRPSCLSPASPWCCVCPTSWRAWCLW